MPFDLLWKCMNCLEWWNPDSSFDALGVWWALEDKVEKRLIPQYRTQLVAMASFLQGIYLNQLLPNMFS